MSVGDGFDGDIGRGVTVGGAVSDIGWGGTLCRAVIGGFAWGVFCRCSR